MEVGGEVEGPGQVGEQLLSLASLELVEVEPCELEWTWRTEPRAGGLERESGLALREQPQCSQLWGEAGEPTHSQRWS